MVTSPSLIDVLRNQCSFIPTYGIETDFAQELVGDRSGRIYRHMVLYVEDIVVY